MPSFHQHLIYQNYLNQCQSFWFYSKCILIIKPRITTVALILYYYRLFLSLGRTKTDHSFSGFQENITGSLAQLQV